MPFDKWFRCSRKHVVGHFRAVRQEHPSVFPRWLPEMTFSLRIHGGDQITLAIKPMDTEGGFASVEAAEKLAAEPQPGGFPYQASDFRIPILLDQTVIEANLEAPAHALPST